MILSYVFVAEMCILGEFLTQMLLYFFWDNFLQFNCNVSNKLKLLIHHPEGMLNWENNKNMI